MKTQAVFIACYVWGKDPDEATKKNEVLGIDKPVNPSMLKGWF